MSAIPKLDVDFLKPFIEGTIHTLKIQCSTEVTVAKPYKKEQANPMQIDIAAIIGVTSSAFNGSLALCFPKESFLKVMENMLGEPFTEIDSDVEDGAAELLNIIFGHAKKVLTDQGYSMEKAIPSIISGNNITVQHVSDSPTVIVPFGGQAGDFLVEIAVN